MLQLNLVQERLLFLSPSVQSGKEKESTITDFKILDGLGTGAFGEVYKVEHKTTKAINALKKISKQLIKQQMMTNQIRNEVKIMYKLNHPNIVKILNHFEEEDFIYLVLEYAQGGQLYNLLREKGSFDEKTAQKYMREMIYAIDYCHSRDPPILHRDIKPENILLDSNGQSKLADFGWSTFANPNTKRQTYCGTLYYLAPEMIDEDGHDVSLDYWGLGVLAYELLTGKVPFAPPTGGAMDKRIIQQQVTDNILKGDVEFPRDFPALAKDLVIKLLSRDPSKRGTIQEIKEHPWLKMSGNKTMSKTPRPQQSNLAGSNKGVESINRAKEPNTSQNAEEIVNKQENVLLSNVEKSSKGKIKLEIISPRTMESPAKRSADLFEIFALGSPKNEEFNKQKIIDRLEKTIEDLKNEITELNSKLQLREQEVESKRNSETKRIRVLEEENKKLRKEIDGIWESLELKEAELLKKSLELKKFEDMGNRVEKYKEKNKTLSNQMKEIQTNLNEANAKLDELQKEKEDEKRKYERLLTNNEYNSPKKSAVNNQKGVEELMKFAKTAIDEMQEKINVYHHDKDSINKIEKELQEKNLKVIKIQSESEKRLNETIRQLEHDHEAKMIKLKEEFKSQLDQVELRNRELILSLEQQLKSLKDVEFNKNEAQAVIEDYKVQIESLTTNNETLRQICTNLQTLREENEKKMNHWKCEVEDLKLKLKENSSRKAK